jgi:hypothetical protein
MNNETPDAHGPAAQRPSSTGPRTDAGKAIRSERTGDGGSLNLIHARLFRSLGQAWTALARLRIRIASSRVTQPSLRPAR